MSVCEEEYINNVFEPDRSQLLSAVVKKTYVSTKEISKTWMAHPTPFTENKMGYLPVPKCQARSKMQYDPPHGPQTAVSSNISRSLKRLCYHRSERAKSCQEGTIIQEHSKMNIRSKLRPDSAVIKEWSQPLDRPCSHHSKRATPTLHRAKRAQLSENVRKRTLGRSYAQSAQLSKNGHGP